MTTITVGGIDITDDVLYGNTQFSALVNGNVGEAAINVRDDGHTYAFHPGQEVWLDFGATRLWGGYVTKVNRHFPFSAFDTSNPESASRYWSLVCADYNALFDRRVIYDEANPATHVRFNYAAGTYDDTVIYDILDNYLNVEAEDGISRAGVERVDVAILDIPGLTSGKGSTNGGDISSAGFTWRQMMDTLSRATGAVYYIDPGKVLHYSDVGESDSTYYLTDTPTTASGVGYQGFEIGENGSRRINDMFVWGATQGSGSIVFSRYENKANQTAHGRWQSSLVLAPLYRQLSADLVARSYVEGTQQSNRGAKDDSISFTCTVFDPVFHAGQKVRTVNSIFGFEKVMPIRRMVIKFIDRDTPEFQMSLSTQIDQPWSWFETIWPRIDFNLIKIITPVPPAPFEVFNRVVSPSAWGTSTDGHRWPSIVPYNVGAARVDLYQGVFFNPDFPNTGEVAIDAGTQPDDSATAPWYGNFTMHASMTYDLPNDARNRLQEMGFFLTQADAPYPNYSLSAQASVSIAKSFYDYLGRYIFTMEAPYTGRHWPYPPLVDGGPTQGTTNEYWEYLPSNMMIQGHTYHYKMMKQGNDWYAKFWDEIYPEPIWMLHDTENAAVPPYNVGPWTGAGRLWVFNAQRQTRNYILNQTGETVADYARNLLPTEGFKYNYIIFTNNFPQPVAPPGYLAVLFYGNGTTTTFNVGQPYYNRSTTVLLNGLRQIVNVNYTENGTSGTIQFDVAPRIADVIVIIFQPFYPRTAYMRGIL